MIETTFVRLNSEELGVSQGAILKLISEKVLLSTHYRDHPPRISTQLMRELVKQTVEQGGIDNLLIFGSAEKTMEVSRDRLERIIEEGIPFGKTELPKPYEHLVLDDGRVKFHDNSFFQYEIPSEYIVSGKPRRIGKILIKRTAVSEIIQFAKSVGYELKTGAWHKVIPPPVAILKPGYPLVLYSAGENFGVYVDSQSQGKDCKQLPDSFAAEKIRIVRFSYAGTEYYTALFNPQEARAPAIEGACIYTQFKPGQQMLLFSMAQDLKPQAKGSMYTLTKEPLWFSDLIAMCDGIVNPKK